MTKVAKVASTLELRDEQGNLFPEIQEIIDQEVQQKIDVMFSKKTLLEFIAENYRNIWGTVRFGAQYGKRVAVFFSGNEPYPKVWQLNPHINTLNVPHAVYLNPTDFSSADDLLNYVVAELSNYLPVDISDDQIVDVQQ
jgi:hypothetical protein